MNAYLFYFDEIIIINLLWIFIIIIIMFAMYLYDLSIPEWKPRLVD